MSEPTVFEGRLRSALRRHVAAGPTAFDALGFAKMVAAAEPRRHGVARGLAWQRQVIPSFPLRRSVAPALAWLLITVVLVAALIASALLAGGRRSLAAWQRIDLPGPAGQLNDVVATDEGYIAVGTAQGNGMVWTSHDGLVWDLVATGDTFAGAELHSAARGDDGFVAVGDVHDRPAPRPAAWFSVDGRTWHQAAAVAGEGGGRMEDVACARGRCVGVGWTVGAEIWWSDDVSHWVKARQFAAADTPGFMPRLVTVVAGGPGFVAAGVTVQGTIWTSADGDTWQSVDLAPGTLPASAWVSTIAVGRDGGLVGFAGTVALAAAGPRASSGAWTSAALPGPTTDRVRLLPSGRITVASVAATAWGYVAVGSLGREGDWAVDPLGQGVLWTSPDGLRWSLREAARSFAGLALERVLRCGDALLVVGTDSTGVSSTWAATQGAAWETAIP